MRVESQPAYVLHAQPYRESSLLLDLLTRDHGRVGLIARGVRGTRAQPLRAALQPLQPLLVDWAGRGELPLLRAAEAAGAALAPHGDALLGAFYLNELQVRLMPRGEAQPRLFWRYAECLGALAEGRDYVWELRRFERDLIGELGYALVLSHEADGETPIDPEAHYRYEPEQGPLRLAAARSGSVSGAALAALADDVMPDSAAMRELRGMMRRVLLHLLGGRELRSWQVLADLAAHRSTDTPR